MKDGDPRDVKYLKCVHVSKNHPSVGPSQDEKIRWQITKNHFGSFYVPQNTLIMAVKIASFGTPSGKTGAYLP
jgi:hypothetical protein